MITTVTRTGFNCHSHTNAYYYLFTVAFQVSVFQRAVLTTRLAYTSTGITHMFSIENIRYYPCQTIACAT
jgi:hypothetical protein